jgi:Tol biopolymer transport system component
MSSHIVTKVQLLVVTLVALAVSGLAIADAVAQDAGNIVYHDPGASELKRTNTLGSFSQTLTHPPAGYTDQSASWSPTGRSVVFERRLGSRNTAYDGQDRQIVVVDRLGQRERVIATGFAPVWSGWSPNKIAFVSWPYMNIPEFQCIYVINHDGTGLQPLSCAESLSDTMPWCLTGIYTCYQKYQQLAWSHDGRYVIAHVGSYAVNYNQPSDTFWRYLLTRTRTSDRAQARVPNTPDALEPIAISMANGVTLYYGTMDSSGSGPATPAIYRVNFLTGVQSRVVSGSRPVVSSDFSKFAFTGADGSNRYARLFYANADGSGALPLAGPTSGVTVAPLDWSRDSSHVLLQRTQGGQDSLHLVTLMAKWRTVRKNSSAEVDAWYQASP